MKILILGAGMMGRAIAFDLMNFKKNSIITIADKNKKSIDLSKQLLQNKNDIEYISLNINNIENIIDNHELVISAVPYQYNYELSKISIESGTHFIDLGGNNDIVQKELSLLPQAETNDVTIIPDCGLAPGLTSVIVCDIAESINEIDFVKIRVGGLPVHPKSPLNYQLVFSPDGLINEYVEKSLVLDHGKIISKDSLTEIETISFPKPFGKMEAFLTSGGCSTLPYTYQKKIKYLYYKTVRYPGHCDIIQTLFSIGLANEQKLKVGEQKIVPRDVLLSLLEKNLPKNGEDVVLLKVICKGIKANERCMLEYTLIDYFDKKNNITSMMRATGYPTSIIAQMILDKTINTRGVFCPHEIVPCEPFFNELKRRNIILKKRLTYI